MEHLLHPLSIKIRPEKHGRTLTQFDIAEIGELLGEMPAYPYVVRMLPGITAGNHYHKKKKEFLVCLEGELKVTLEDIVTKERIAYALSADSNLPAPATDGIVVMPQIAHVVENTGNSTATLLVFATHSAREKDDDFEYIV